jgi:hypothetical protein
LIYYEAISPSTKWNAQFPVLEIATAIPVSRKFALPFIVGAITSHDEKFMNSSGKK